MIDLTPILQAVISLCAALLTAFAVPWVRHKVGEERSQHLYELAKIAVRAAEQIYGAGHGDAKAQYVMSYLRDNGYDVDKDELRAALEAAVYQLNRAMK